MRKTIVIFLTALLLAGAAQAYAAVVNKDDYHEVHILPAPKDVKIDANPFRNAVKNFQQLFKTGSSVEFSFQADPTADPKREKPAKGDVRILFAFSHEGKPLATLYRPVSDDKTYAAHFESPTGMDDFDEVRLHPAQWGHLRFE